MEHISTVSIDEDWICAPNAFSPLAVTFIKDIMFLTGQIPSPITDMEKLMLDDNEISQRRKASNKRIFKFVHSFSMLISTIEQLLSTLSQSPFRVGSLLFLIGASFATPRAVYSLDFNHNLGISTCGAGERCKLKATRNLTRHLIQVPWLANHPVGNANIALEVSCLMPYSEALDALRNVLGLVAQFDTLFGVRPQLPKWSNRRRIIRHKFQIGNPSVSRSEHFGDILLNPCFEIEKKVGASIDSGAEVDNVTGGSDLMSDRAIEDHFGGEKLGSLPTKALTFWIVSRRGIKPLHQI